MRRIEIPQRSRFPVAEVVILLVGNAEGPYAVRHFVGEERTRRAEQIREIHAGVAFDVFNVVNDTAGGGFSKDAWVFVSSRVCIMQAR